jgi:hypothetical protein
MNNKDTGYIRTPQSEFGHQTVRTLIIRNGVLLGYGEGTIYDLYLDDLILSTVYTDVMYSPPTPTLARVVKDGVGSKLLEVRDMDNLRTALFAIKPHDYMWLVGAEHAGRAQLVKLNERIHSIQEIKLRAKSA